MMHVSALLALLQEYGEIYQLKTRLSVISLASDPSIMREGDFPSLFADTRQTAGHVRN